MDEIKMLADSLTEYIKEKTTSQENAIGFIEGYKKAFEDIRNNKNTIQWNKLSDKEIEILFNVTKK